MATYEERTELLNSIYTNKNNIIAEAFVSASEIDSEKNCACCALSTFSILLFPFAPCFCFYNCKVCAEAKKRKKLKAYITSDCLIFEAEEAKCCCYKTTSERKIIPLELITQVKIDFESCNCNAPKLKIGTINEPILRIVGRSRIETDNVIYGIVNGEQFRDAIFKQQAILKREKGRTQPSQLISLVNNTQQQQQMQQSSYNHHENIYSLEPNQKIDYITHN
eukprot:TRINITY_DN1644_c0_g1_i1.p1 TRINITY_DN1644_c0_g1~~TRINITY_DN1644_c0_g1_i1.p1  ORF type:complete len:222 (-),score=71.67 TRINITY_DN1644_c0_g1_i1:107-772(-)